MTSSSTIVAEDEAARETLDGMRKAAARRARFVKADIGELIGP